MSYDDFNQQFVAAVAAADEALVEHGRIDPLYLIVDRGHRIHMVVADNTSPERKHVSMEIAKLTAIAADAEVVVHATPGVPPSKSDRRREVVLVLGAARDESRPIQMRLSAREILRADDGAAIGTSPLDVPDDGGEHLGPLGNILPPDSPRLPSA